MKKWIMLFQTPHDRVKFQTNELDESTSMPYRKFIEFVYTNFFIKDRQSFTEALDSFKTILIDGTGEFIIISPEIDLSKYSFDELFKLNEKKEEETKLDIAVSNSKKFIDQIWKTNRSKNPFSLGKRKPSENR
jgi:hypothetical protein